MIFLPSTVPPKSAIAILMASTPPAPIDVRVHAGHVVDVADHHLVAGGQRRAGQRRDAEHRRRCQSSTIRSFMVVLLVLLF